MGLIGDQQLLLCSTSWPWNQGYVDLWLASILTRATEEEFVTMSPDLATNSHFQSHLESFEKSMPRI